MSELKLNPQRFRMTNDAVIPLEYYDAVQNPVWVGTWGGYKVYELIIGRNSIDLSPESLATKFSVSLSDRRILNNLVWVENCWFLCGFVNSDNSYNIPIPYTPINDTDVSLSLYWENYILHFIYKDPSNTLTINPLTHNYTMYFIIRYVSTENV